MTEKYSEGDLVEAVKGDAVLRGRLKSSVYQHDEGFLLSELGWSLGTLRLNGFTVTVIEKAAPKLPTEPGIYIESDKAVSHTNIWTLAPNGKWLSAADAKYDSRAAEFAPFTRLEEVPVTAEKVLVAVSRAAWADGFSGDLERIAKEFGVLPLGAEKS